MFGNNNELAEGEVTGQGDVSAPCDITKGWFAELIDSSTFFDGLVLFPGGPLSNLIKRLYLPLHSLLLQRFILNTLLEFSFLGL